MESKEKSGEGEAVYPLPNRLAAIQQAEHVTTAHGVGAVVTRPPLNGDRPATGANPHRGDGTAGDVLPIDPGVQEAHRVRCFDPSKIPERGLPFCIRRYRFGY